MKKICLFLKSMITIIVTGMYIYIIFINFISIPNKPTWDYWLVTIAISIGLPIFCAFQWFYIEYLENKIEKMMRGEG